MKDLKGRYGKAAGSGDKGFGGLTGKLFDVLDAVGP